MKDFVIINTDVHFNAGNNRSPIVRCLLYENGDRDYFRRQIISNQCPDDSIDEKIDRIVEWRNLLSERFKDNKDEIKLCVNFLGHLVSAHYSGKSQSYDAIGYTLTKLSNAMSENKPLIFTFCFGGYKSHTSFSHPEVDWAELFHMNYFVSYLYPIIKMYPYGVRIEYESEEVSIQFNNVPQIQTDKYTLSFNKLLDYFVKTVQIKYGILLNMRLVLARDLYKNGVSQLYSIMEEKKPLYTEYFEQLTEGEKKKWIQRAEANFMWDNGIKNYGVLSESEKYDVYKNARIMNEAFLDADYILRESWFEDPYRIPITGTWGTMPSAQPIDGWLHIKSTADSKVDCWIGTGFLKKVRKHETVSYHQTILSKTQVEKIKSTIEYQENDDEELKAISKNFNSIPTFIEE